MKKIVTFSIIIAITLLSACRKSDNPKMPALTRVPVPLVVKDGGSDAIDVTNLASFQGKFDVGVYFKSDVPPSKYDVVIRKNANDGNVKLFKAGISTFPTTLTITAADLSTLFGTPVVLGDSYDIGVDLYTQSGAKYEGFPMGAIGYGTGVTGLPGASVSINYSAICQFHPEEYAGVFDVEVDPWGDFGQNGFTNTTVTVVDPTTLSFPSPVSGAPVVLKVNPKTNEITVNSSGYGNYGDGPITVVSGGGSTLNFVAPCDGTINLALNYTLPTLGAAYSGGPYKLVLKKH